MLRALGPLLVLALGAGVIGTSDLDTVRFSSVSNSPGCSVEQLVNLPESIDVAVLGSSRVRRGIAPDVMETESGGAFPTVVNFGRPGLAMYRNNAILDHLIESGRTPKVVIVEFNVDRMRTGTGNRWDWDFDEAGFLTYGEILRYAPGDVSGRARVANILRGWHQKLELSVLGHFTGRTREVMEENQNRVIDVCFLDSFDKVLPRRQKALKWAEDKQTEIHGNPEAAFDDRFVDELGAPASTELVALQRLRETAERHGIRLFVLRLQAYTDPPLSAAVQTRLRDLIPEFVYPPEAEVRAMDRLYSDPHHMNREGRVLYTRWLTQTILAEVGAP